MPKNSPLITSLTTLDRDILKLYIQQLGTSVEKLEAVLCRNPLIG